MGFKSNKVLPVAVGFYVDGIPPKQCIIPSLLNYCIEVTLLILLIAQIMMILGNEYMKRKRQFRRDI